MTPLELKLHKKSAILEVVFPDAEFHLPVEYLRVFSPSAEVQGHSPQGAVLQFGKKDVNIMNIEPQGNYAIKITFSDGHDSGIYSWQYLYDLGRNYEANWKDYLEKLEKAGKKREAAFIAVSR